MQIIRDTLAKTVGKLFFQPRLDKDGKPAKLRPAFGKLNQMMIEAGCSPPWIMSKEECMSYWKSRRARTGDNSAEKYAEKDPKIIDFLHAFWFPYVKKDHSIIELGCNAGANLFYLQKKGYEKVGGIEINGQAIKLMQKRFPTVFNRKKIICGSLEDVLPDMASDSVDAILSIGVAFHIHPKSNFLFREMQRISKKYICFIEDEVANNSYVFSRNYNRVFSKLGARQLKEKLIDADTKAPKEYWGLTARLFSV